MQRLKLSEHVGISFCFIFFVYSRTRNNYDNIRQLYCVAKTFKHKLVANNNFSPDPANSISDLSISSLFQTQIHFHRSHLLTDISNSFI